MIEYICYQILGTGEVIDLGYLCGVSQVPTIIAPASSNERQYINEYRLIRPQSRYQDSQVVTDGYRYCTEADQRSPLELSQWLASLERGSASDVRVIRDHWSAVGFYAPLYLCD